MGRHFLVNGLLTAGRQEARDRVRLGACGPPARPTVWSTELRPDFPRWPGGESWARRRLSASPQGRPGEQPRTRVCHTHSGPGQMSHSPLSHGYEVLACIWPMPYPGKHPLPMPVTPYWLRTCGQIHATPGLHQQRKKKKKKKSWLLAFPETLENLPGTRKPGSGYVCKVGMHAYVDCELCPCPPNADAQRQKQ